jgi:pilus assembly protein CpaE
MMLAGYDVGIGGSAPKPLTATRAADRAGEVIAVFGVKGGVGKTTIAVNLAVGLARAEDRKTLLVDADLYFGDVSVLLDVAPKRSIFDLCDLADLEVGMLTRLVAEHASGVSILSSPPDLTTVELLRAERLAAAINAYRDAFDYVVVDMPSALNEHTLQILDVADRILLATTPEVSAIHQTGRFISVAETLGYRNKIQLILNRADAGVSPTTVEEILKTRVEATVVSAGRAAVSAGNRGTPLLLDQEA